MKNQPLGRENRASSSSTLRLMLEQAPLDMLNERLHAFRPAARTEASISLGGNVGNVAETFRSAIRRLQEHPEIELKSWSSLYESEPMGNDAGDVFSNAAVVIETSLEPMPLLRLLQSIEEEHDRSRDVRWGPRTLDLDLILSGSDVVSENRLKIPHPDCWYRRFVLDPLAEIAPDAKHPILRESVQTLLNRIQADTINVGLIGFVIFADEWLNQTSQRFPGARLQRIESGDSSADLVIDFRLTPGQPTPPFHIPGFGFDPQQRILDILFAARGMVSRVATINLS